MSYKKMGNVIYVKSVYHRWGQFHISMSNHYCSIIPFYVVKNATKREILDRSVQLDIQTPL